MKKLTKPEDIGLLEQSNGSRGSADFLTVATWAIKLQVSKRTIFRMIDEKIIPKYDFAVGKTRRWHVSTYEQWAAKQRGGN